MIKKLIAAGSLLSLAACSSMDNSTYKVGTLGATQDMVDQQAADDLRQTNAVLVLVTVLTLGFLLNENNGGFAPMAQDYLPPPP